MKKDNTYRYTLQFPARTKEQNQVGELLERLGSRKSRFIVMVIVQYIEAHPEVMESKAQISIRSEKSSTYSREELKEIILQILSEVGYSENASKDTDSGGEGIETMLDSLGIF